LFFCDEAIRKIIQVNPLACGEARYVGVNELIGPVIKHRASTRQDPFEDMDPIMDKGAYM